jgi:hypothetical protein
MGCGRGGGEFSFLMWGTSKNQSRKNLAINNYVLQGAQKRFLWAQATAVI